MSYLPSEAILPMMAKALCLWEGGQEVPEITPNRAATPLQAPNGSLAESAGRMVWINWLAGNCVMHTIIRHK